MSEAAADQQKCRSLRVCDIEINKTDSTGRNIEQIYTEIPPLYAVYRTSERVAVQYADDAEKAAEQRAFMASLNGVRSQITGLIDGWQRSKADRLKARAVKYNSRVAACLIMCLEGDKDHALPSLIEIKTEIYDERTSWGRFEYLISAFIVSIVLVGLFFLAKHWLPFPPDTGGLWLAGRAGTVGAFFSIAIAIRSRTVLTDLHRRDNIADAVLRIVIGVTAAGVLFLLLHSNLVRDFK